MSLCAVILTCNEERHIVKAVQSVQKVTDEIFVIDSGSSDRTVELAEAQGAKILSRAWDSDFAAARNFIHDKTDADWILQIDADERISDQLADNIKRVVDAGINRIYCFRRTNHAFGKQFGYGVFRPDKVRRLYPRGKAVWAGAVHENLGSGLSEEFLTGSLDHYTYDSFEQYFKKLNNYTTIWAEEAYGKGKRTNLVEGFIHAVYALFKMVVIKTGFLDGLTGLVVCCFNFTYTLLKYTKLNYLQIQNKNDETVSLPKRKGAKIAFVVARYVSGKGGMETVVSKTIQNWKYADDKVDLIVSRRTGSPSDWVDKVPHIKLWFAARWLEYPLLVLHMFYVLFRLQPEVIVAADAKAVMYSCWYRDIFDKKACVISWLHSTIGEKRKSRVLAADWHFCISSGMAEELTGFGITKDKTSIIYNPADKEQLLPRSASPVFVYMGRLVMEREKCVGDFLRALVCVKGPWRAMIVGDGQDEYELKILAEKLGIYDKITWTGWLSEPWSAVTEASALVLTSEFEAFGMVLVEAMQRGIPCVSADCPSGPREIIINGENGWLYPPRDVNRLAELLQNIIDDPAILPDAEKVQKSVDKFSTPTVIANMRRNCLEQVKKI